MKFEFQCRVNLRVNLNYAYDAKAHGHFSKEHSDGIEFRVEESPAERRMKKAHFGLIEIVPIGAEDITEEYVNLGTEIINAFREMYKQEGYVV